MPAASQSKTADPSNCFPLDSYTLSIGVWDDLAQDGVYTCKIVTSATSDVRVALTYFWGVADISHDVGHYLRHVHSSFTADHSQHEMPIVVTLTGGAYEFTFKKKDKYVDCPDTFKVMVSAPEAANSATAGPF